MKQELIGPSRIIESLVHGPSNRIAKKELKNHEEKIVFICIEKREMQQVVSHS